ncbi:2370_t:CDS:2 [Entrophospora sp. SA101]|nr:2370_t:CDS:2 [Entrophospora sp. SA101]
MSRGVDCDSHQYFPLPTLSTSITRPQSTSSIDEIRKKFTEIEIENNEIKKKYVEVEAENTDLKEIIKENARREAESMKLKARVEELERYKKENEKRFEKLEEKQLKNVNNFENIANVSDSVINHCIDTDTKSLDDDTSELIDERCDDTPASDIFDNTSNCDLRHESLTQCSAPSNCTESESLKDKEMNNIIDFLVERDNERIRNEIRERNRGGKLQREAPTGNFPKEDTYASNIKSSVPSDQKKEQGLIQEISIKDQNNITEISSNNIPQNHVPEIDYSTSDKDIIYDLPGEAKLRVSNSTEVSNTSILSNSETIPVSTEIQASR